MTKLSCLGGGILWRFEENADAQVHERLGEVNYRLARIVDGHGSDGQVGALVDQLTNDSVPFARFMVEEPEY